MLVRIDPDPHYGHRRRRYTGEPLAATQTQLILLYSSHFFLFILFFLRSIIAPVVNNLWRKVGKKNYSLARVIQAQRNPACTVRERKNERII